MISLFNVACLLTAQRVDLDSQASVARRPIDATEPYVQYANGSVISMPYLFDLDAQADVTGVHSLLTAFALKEFAVHNCTIYIKPKQSPRHSLLF